MSKRIGILTLPLRDNYGGILQAVALAQFLKAEGHEVVLLDRQPWMPRSHRLAAPLLRRLPFQDIKKIRSRYQVRAVHMPFISRWIGPDRPELYSTDEMAKAVRRHRLSAVVVGSDQVWRPNYMPSEDPAEYFLGFSMPQDVRRIAYAASFGVDVWEFPDLTDRISTCLRQFDAVSVREDTGVTLCRQLFGREQCTHVLDPTMLVDPEIYMRMAAPAREQTRTGRLLWRYTLDASPEQTATAEAARAMLGPDCAVRGIELTGGQQSFLVHDWLHAFMKADFVVTDSFHGMVFSILFNKEFIATPNYSRGATRFTSLLKMLGLSDRLAERGDVEAARALASQPIDYGRVNQQIDRLRTTSRDFLRTALG